MAPYCYPGLEQSSTCFILSLCQPSLACLALCTSSFLSLPIPCSLRYGGPVHTVPSPPRLLFSEGSQTKLSWRNWGSKPAGHVTGHLETGACMVFAGAHTFGVRELSLFKAGTVIQGSEIRPQSFRLEGDRPCGLVLLCVWGYTTRVLASGYRRWARMGGPQRLLLPLAHAQQSCTCSAGAPLLSHSAALISLILTEWHRVDPRMA